MFLIKVNLILTVPIQKFKHTDLLKQNLEMSV